MKPQNFILKSDNFILLTKNLVWEHTQKIQTQNLTFTKNLWIYSLEVVDKCIPILRFLLVFLSGQIDDLQTCIGGPLAAPVRLISNLLASWFSITR